MSAIPTFERGKAFPTRDGYGRGLYEAGRGDDRIIALDADLSESTRSLWFGREHPDRFFNMGISEQDMVVTAAGMASTGKVVFCSTFAIFMERAFEQVRNAVARTNYNVKIVGSHGGLMTGEDGSSAQCIEDVGLYRLLPNFAVCVPADAVEAEKAVAAMVARPGPAYLRLTRQKVPVLFGNDHTFTWGKGQVLREVADVTVAACGAVVSESLKAAELLTGEGISVEVLNLASVKPLDRELLVRSARKTGLVVTVEDHNIVGGLGGAVAEALAEDAPTAMVRIGVQDRFAESGSPADLYEKYGLSGPKIAQQVRAAMAKKR
jgi:transketolase